MPENDIYGNKNKYENFVRKLDMYKIKPEENSKRKYYVKNEENMVYFKRLFVYFDSKDISYARRMKVMQTMRTICFVTEKNLKNCEREDLDGIIVFMHSACKTVISKRDFIKDLKFIWRVLFPEKDHRGRIDETLVPYAVRHISRKIDKSKEKLRNDRLTIDEFRKIIRFFQNEPKIQAYLMLAFESLGRPQEILFTRIKDYEFYDSYGKIWISEHGKEGTGFLQSIDSYPFVQKWFQMHPLKDNPDAFFFISESNRSLYKQLKNNAINKKIKHACKHLGINKNVTCYSLKRNGITYRRLRGDSDLEIQHTARWTSTKQLQIYDMSNQEDALRVELIKRGIVNPETKEEELIQPDSRLCGFCSCKNSFADEFCNGCKRPLNREKIQEIARKHEMLINDDMMDKVQQMEQKINEMLKLSF